MVKKSGFYYKRDFQKTVLPLIWGSKERMTKKDKNFECYNYVSLKIPVHIFFLINKWRIKAYHSYCFVKNIWMSFYYQFSESHKSRFVISQRGRICQHVFVVFLISFYYEIRSKKYCFRQKVYRMKSCTRT